MELFYMPEIPLSTIDLTPVEKRGTLYFKRDDYYEFAGVRGGKVRTAQVLCQGSKGLTTAGSRHSPQIVIVSHIANYWKIPFRGHTSAGELSPELKALGKHPLTTIKQWKPGYNTVIKKRALDDAMLQGVGWRCIPFGMQDPEAVLQTGRQTRNIPTEVKRVVVPVGSAMSLCGILHGLRGAGHLVPVLGVQVGADPRKTIYKYLPAREQTRFEIVKAKESYDERLEDVTVEGVRLDPVYEAKCACFLQPGDLLWIVGIRN